MSDRSDSPPPALDPNTLALLTQFIGEKTAQQQRFDALTEAAAAEDAPTKYPSVDEYRATFAEDWQLSQFWYTTPFAERFAQLLHGLCDENTSIAFLCCPTAWVAFQHLKPLDNAKLLEVDGRFGVLAPRNYIRYDMEEPLAIPEHLTNSVDIAVVDPPFLNEYTNEHIVTTLRKIMRPNAKLIVLTSTSVESILQRLYDTPPLGPLRRTKVEVLHGQLRNDFGCWANWEGSEELKC
ncbi:hypothetical protein HMN09_01029800 [Mycena chlorophos]|uniref:Protein-lysine N-methyltransferase EFM5 n=1 Tax=Mycena chlorophos TaxID=658473 RepID=A0A8H6SEI7_MYCCL|nr:hypothetical protein HMN09_01029800 [Mycena chlorophos]